MNNFAQALARIEELLKEGNFTEVGLLLDGYAGSIVQLGKVAESMALDLQTIAKEAADEWGEPLSDHSYLSAKAYDELMEGKK